MTKILLYSAAGLLVLIGMHLLLWGFLKRQIASAKAAEEERRDQRDE